MERLEKLIIPIACLVCAAAWGLTQTSADTAIIIARIVGIILVTFLCIGFAARVIVKRKREQRMIEEMRRVAEAEAAGEAVPSATTDPSAPTVG